MTEEREVFPVDVLFVGAGPANLSGAYHLVKLIEEHKGNVEVDSALGAGTTFTVTLPVKSPLQDKS